MADKNFKGGPGGRLKAAAANFNKPTMQDSLDLYNNAMALENFYRKSKIGYKEQDPGADFRNLMLKNPFKILDSANKDFNESIKNYPAQDVIKNNAFITLKNSNVPQYRKDLDKNKFSQREITYGALNVDAPMALYDRRINPTLFSFYSGTVPGQAMKDEVEIFKYDPLAVKPVSMLTTQERIEREKKYGAISPVQKPKPKPKPVPVIKRKVSEEVEPLAPRQSPAPTFTPGEIVAPVMRPVSVPQTTPMEEPMMEEEVITDRPVGRKLPKAVMPRRQGGWGNQSLLMQLFPKLYER
jgi:hypothetical protein